MSIKSKLYWHCNPVIYGEDKIPLNNSQKIQLNKDGERIATFEKHGFKVIILWENEIYNDIEKIMKENLLTIYPRNDYTQDIQDKV